MLIFWEVFQKPENLRTGLQAYIFGAYVPIISTIYNYINGNVAIPYEGRYSATGVNAVDLALILIMGLPIAMHLFFTAGQNKQGAIIETDKFGLYSFGYFFNYSDWKPDFPACGYPIWVLSYLYTTDQI